MTPANFLRDYWQQRPLLIRGFFADGVDATAPDDLAGLACEEAALSRIVTHDPRRDRWTVRNGPFVESDFAKLGDRHWTLLVQDVDKWDQDVAALLDRFAFLPSWRIDDVMVSYATEGGGVGAHVDNYDVFLIQGLGQRRWRISSDQNAPQDFRTDSELKLLREFLPTHEWTLASGDALYLPPGFAHDGVAVGECLTYSVGMRAPSQAEMLLDFAEFLAEPLGEEQRYADPALAPARDASEIDDAAINRVAAAMSYFSNVDKSTIAQWFGRFITRYRSVQMAAAPQRSFSERQVAQRLPGSALLRNPFSRFAWRRDGRMAELFVAGAAWRCPIPFAQQVCAARELFGDLLLPAAKSPAALTVLTELLNAGHLQFARRRG
jgi:50S ribosomal protein L16 3-hydroxylase